MKKRLMLLTLIFLFALVGCSGKQPAASNEQNSGQNLTQGVVSSMNQDEAKRNMDENENIILLDVRTPEEYKESHIPGSILIPISTINKGVEKELPDKDATIYVYCRSGNRSESAAKMLMHFGYTQVYNIGGITTWPYETEKGTD
jgi:rhodanese-related sulfurtransferase